jgi:hypothetical protein
MRVHPARRYVTKRKASVPGALTLRRAEICGGREEQISDVYP